MDEVAALWAYLARAPLLWLTATLAAYAAAEAAAEALGRPPLANPVLMAVLILAALLGLTATPYRDYFEGAQFIHFLLGPATVALALPLYDNLGRVRATLLPMAAALLVGSLVAILSAVGLAAIFGVRGDTLVSLVPKSATAPVALGVSEAIGGIPALTAVLVIITGIVGAVIASPLLNRTGFADYRARGFAVGLAAHGIGTAHAFRVHRTAGAFAGIGMGLNAVLTALLAPIVAAILF